MDTIALLHGLGPGWNMQTDYGAYLPNAFLAGAGPSESSNSRSTTVRDIGITVISVVGSMVLFGAFGWMLSRATR